MAAKILIIFCLAIVISAVPLRHSRDDEEESEPVSELDEPDEQTHYHYSKKYKQDGQNQISKNSRAHYEDREPAPVVELNKHDIPTNKILPFHVPEKKYNDEENKEAQFKDKHHDPAPVVEIDEHDIPTTGELPFHVPDNTEDIENEEEAHFDIRRRKSAQVLELDEQDTPANDVLPGNNDNIKDREAWSDEGLQSAPVAESDEPDTPTKGELPYHVPDKRDNEEDRESETIDEAEDAFDESDEYDEPTHYKLPYSINKHKIDNLNKMEEPSDYKLEYRTPVESDTRYEFSHPIYESDSSDTKKAKRSRIDHQSREVAERKDLSDTDDPKNYEFQYSIHDSESGDIKKVKEARAGDAVQGSYSFIQPDGLERIVEYTADKENGFNAIVRYKDAPTQAPVREEIEYVANPFSHPMANIVYPASYTKSVYAAPDFAHTDVVNSFFGGK